VCRRKTQSVLTISAVYLPPKHTVKQGQLEDSYNTLGRRFIAGGDCYAKHTNWGSRLFTPNNKNDCIQTFPQGLTPTESTDYSLWKAIKKIKQVKKLSPPLRTSQGTWERSNVEGVRAFAEHLVKVFQPHPSENEPERSSTYATSRDPLPTRTTNQPSQKS
jgi:hypothetical protein